MVSEKRVYRLSNIDLKDYLIEYSKKYSCSYYNQMLSSLRILYIHILNQPRKLNGINYKKDEPKEVVILSTKEIKDSLFEIKNIKHRCIINLLYIGALRISELQNIEINDIDSENNKIRINTEEIMKERNLLVFIAALVVSILLLLSLFVRLFDWFDVNSYGQYATVSTHFYILPVIIIWLGWFLEDKKSVLIASALMAVNLYFHLENLGVLSGDPILVTAYAPAIKTTYVLTLILIVAAIGIGLDISKPIGNMIVDIGGGTTDIAIFKDGIIRHTAVIPFGGNVITEDIKEGCSIIEKQAELLKIKFGSAWPGENKETEIVSIPGLRGREPKEITLKNLSKIIHARVQEIIEHVYLEIKNYGHETTKRKLIAGIVLTGGGSQLNHLRQLVEYITGMDARIGYPNEHLAGDSDETLSSPSYATAVGLLIEGLNKEVEASEELLEKTLEETPIVEEVKEIVKPKRKSFFEKFTDGLKDFLDNAE